MSEATTTADTTATTTAATTPATTQAVTSGISEPWAKSWIKPDFTLEPTALERLPDHLKGMKDTLSKYGKLEDVFTSYQSLQSMAGKKALAPLPADSPDHVKAERKALLDAISGVPNDAKGYGIAKPADLPDAHWNPKMAESFAAWSHKHSVSPAAAKELMDLNIATVRDGLTQQTQDETEFWQREDQNFTARLKQENIPTDRAQALIEKGAIAFGLDLKSEQTKTFLNGSDARMMALKHAMAIGEDTGITGGNNPVAGGYDPKQAANDIVNNPANPLHAAYWNKGNKYSQADQQRAQETAKALFRQAAEKDEKENGTSYRR